MKTPSKVELRQQEFINVVTAAATKFASTDASLSSSMWISIAPMAVPWCVPLQVQVATFAESLNEIGEVTTALGFADVQIFLQRREAKSGAPTETWGVIIDVDEPVDDLLHAHLDAGTPLPTAYWQTEHGHKAAYVFDRAVEPAVAERFAMELTIAFDGGDARSWVQTQAQRLPTCLKSTPNGLKKVEFPALTANPVPFAIAEWKVQLPACICRLLGATSTLNANERQAVETHLADLGIPAPDELGSRALYRACPAASDHDSKCCYVNRAEDGRINVTCLGGHDGEGSKKWSESQLYALATNKPSPEDNFDIVRDIPATWAGESFIRYQLAGKMSADLIDAVLKVWLLAKAELDIKRWLHVAAEIAAEEDAEIAKTPTVDEFLEIYRQRLHGIGAGPFQVFFDDGRKILQLSKHDGRALPIRTKGDSLSDRTHRHEWAASSLYTMTHKIVHCFQQKYVVRRKGFPTRAASAWNKAMSGHPGCLAELGIPIVIAYELPVAYVRDSSAIDRRSKTLIEVRVAKGLAGDPSFDALEYFRSLYRQGRLPLATEDDAIRLVMAIASPLLRHVAPGLLGVYWMIGPPGAGKDFLTELVADLWRAATGAEVKAKFDINLKDDLEFKRSFYAAGTAVFARAKEAGKRPGMIEVLIRFAGTDQISARGMYKNEIEVANSFTYLADSAEDLPERKEISRRTVVINVARVEDSATNLGAVRQQILNHAGDILANLKARVEAQPKEFYLQRTQPSPRPVIPVALAELFGVELPQIHGRNLDELFEAMLSYITTHAGAEGREQQKQARSKDSELTKAFPSYRLSHFADTMKGQVGLQQLFKDFPNRRAIDLALQRETDYPDVARKKAKYLRVEIGSQPYAFILIKDRRNFVLEPELTFCNTLGITPIGPCQPLLEHADASAAPNFSSPTLSAAPASEEVEGEFTDADLLSPDERINRQS